MKKKNLLLTAIAIFGLTTITFGQTVPSYVPTSGLVGWWPFNGNANDESGNGNNAVMQGNATFALDRYSIANSSYAGDLTSGADITTLNNFPFGNSERTISLWFQNNTPYPGGNRQLFSYGDNNSGGRFGLYMDGTSIGVEHVGGARRCAYTPDGIWHNFTVTYPASGMGTNDIMLYFDGVLQTSSNLNPVSSLNTANSYIHWIGTLGFSPGWLYAFSGKIDDIGIWNRALTPQEITDLYNGCQLAVNTQPSSQQININNNAQFVVGSSDPNATYQWQTDLGVGFQNLNSVGLYSGTTTNTLTVSNVTLSNNNQQFRCIISSGSCSDTSNVAVLTVNNNVGINETTQDNIFTVFPNPAQSIINVKADNKLIGDIYTIYDNTGRVVLTGKLNSQYTTIELNNLSGGVYMFSVGENMKQTFKVFKE
jgi:hypothetical protein